jgi:general secretion pathway protein G
MDFTGETRAMEKNETKKLTLCDGCVLILVFGIAAVLFSPRLTQAVERDKLSDLVDRLYTIRLQIKLYKLQHDGLLPGQWASGESVTSKDFVTALQEQQYKDSGLSVEGMLENPYIQDTGRCRTITCVNDPEAMPAGNERTAWWFNAATGDFYACDSKFHTNY